MPFKDPIKRKLYKKKWNQDHKPWMRDYMKLWRAGKKLQEAIKKHNGVVLDIELKTII